MTIGTLVQWLDSSEAVLGLIIAVTGSAASGWFSWHQRNLARRERSKRLVEVYAGADPGGEASGGVDQFEDDHFRQSYGIYAQFIADFRQAAAEDLRDADPRPAWLNATRKLEIFLFGVALSPEPLAGPVTTGSERGIRPSEV